MKLVSESLNELYNFERRSSSSLKALDIGKNSTENRLKRFKIEDPANLGFEDSLKKALLKFRINDNITVYSCDWYLNEFNAEISVTLSDKNDYYIRFNYDEDPKKTIAWVTHDFKTIKLRPAAIENLMIHYKEIGLLTIIGIIYYDETRYVLRKDDLIL